MDSNSKSKGNDLVCVQAVADDLASIAARIRAAMGRSIECIVAIGQELSFVKGKLPHGRFNRWIVEEFHFSERTAQNYMNAAAAFADRPATVAYLPATLVYDLAAKTTPPGVRADIVSLLEYSANVAPDEIATRLRDARQAVLLKRTEARAAAALEGLSAEERKRRERNDRKRSRSKAARESD